MGDLIDETAFDTVDHGSRWIRPGCGWLMEYVWLGVYSSRGVFDDIDWWLGEVSLWTEVSMLVVAFVDGSCWWFGAATLAVGGRVSFTRRVYMMARWMRMMLVVVSLANKTLIYREGLLLVLECWFFQSFGDVFFGDVIVYEDDDVRSRVVGFFCCLLERKRRRFWPFGTGTSLCWGIFFQWQL